ncbi:MAG: DUF4097 domain-containing protein [Xanthomonadaceae bacterium]|jgi:hypothetical protein|nr:DUF4097 domain-containing protein [Xanthomonadaceae bacterium]
MQKSLAFCSLLLLPALAFAQNESCQYSVPVNLQLNTTGVTSVIFNVGSHDLVVTAAPRAAGNFGLTGRACTSNTSWLSRLSVSQKKVGTILSVDLKSTVLPIGRNAYAYLELDGTIPNDLDVNVNVSSGNASFDGTASLLFNVASGYVEGTNIGGWATGNVASGDVKLENIGALYLFSLASGEVQATQVNGPATVAAVASGNVYLRDVQGVVQTFAVASGTIDVRNVKGNVSVTSLGAGDLNARNIDGNLTVKTKLSAGKIKYENVSGSVNIPAR